MQSQQEIVKTCERQLRPNPGRSVLVWYLKPMECVYGDANVVLPRWDANSAS